MHSTPDHELRQALALHQQGRLREAFDAYDAILARRPDHAGALHYSALALHQAGHSDAALPRLERAVALAPDEADAWSNLALVLQAVGRVGDALAALAQATRRAPRDAAVWENLAAMCLEASRPADAERAARRATELAPGSLGGWYNLALALLQLQRLPDADTAIARALALAPDAVALHGVKATIEAAQGRLDAARSTLAQAIRIAPREASLHFQLATVCEKAGDLAAAAEAFEQVTKLGDPQGAALSQLLFLRKRLADWHDLAALRARFAAGVAAGQALLSPFCLLSDPSSRALQRQCAQGWSRAFVSGASRGTDAAEGVGATRQGVPRERLTIGYLSADFHMHATALLTAGLFEHHDRKRYHVVGYSTGADDRSPLRKRLESAFDAFVDARGWPADRIVARMRADGVDILVDLKGHTDDARMDVLALRPAPIQASYLGYPGTTGAPFIDYVIGDAIVTPLAHGADYTECIVQLPGSYQVNDRRRVLGQAPERASLGLPPAGPVLSCFNQTYKINPQVLDAWAAILARVPDAVLWLLARSTDDPAIPNLRREAAARGVAPERLVFATSRPNDAYLALYAHATLFLDTWPYNGHTTASDALWAGCPVITMLGDTFAGRVAASVVTAVGLPELVAESVEAYVQHATDLARNAPRCEALHRYLEQEGRASRLFDVACTTRNLERAFEAMVAQHAAGVRQPIVVPEG